MYDFILTNEESDLLKPVEMNSKKSLRISDTLAHRPCILYHIYLVYEQQSIQFHLLQFLEILIISEIQVN